MICIVGAVGAVLCHDRQRGQRCCGRARTCNIGNVAVVQWLCKAMSCRVDDVVPVLICAMQHHCCDVSCSGDKGVSMAAWSAGFLSLIFLDNCTRITQDSLV